MGLRKPSVIATANERVGIEQVLRWVGVDVSDDVLMGRGRKLRCPFGAFYHSDGGYAPAMRIYPEGNYAWCFSCTVRYTPVSLARQAWDVDWATAAAMLLDRIGYKPVSLAQAWANVVEHIPEPSRALLAEALKTYCRRTWPCWTTDQFEPDVAGRLSTCLNLLDLVKTDEDAILWLDTTKRVMDVGRSLHVPSPRTVKTDTIDAPPLTERNAP